MKSNQMQLVVLGMAVILSPAVLSAQDPNNQANRPDQQQQQSTPATQDSGANIGVMTQAMRDKMFLRNAAEGGLVEVKLGQLAAQKGSSEEVKTFGQKMVDDHTAINADIASVADSLGVRLPKTLSKEDQAEYDKLNDLSGSAFDTEYLTVMVKAHHADLRAFRMALDTSQDTPLQDVATKALKVIRQHTIMVDKLARDKGIPVPARPGSHPS
jgi:putative membrane protein